METLQIVAQETENFTKQWEFWLAVGIQLIALIGVIWRATLFMEKRLSEIHGRLKVTEDELRAIDQKTRRMEERVDRIEEQFNHRFTEYKDFVRDLIDARMNDILKKLENHTTCTTKHLGSIEKSLAYLKGRQKVGFDEENHDGS